MTAPRGELVDARGIAERYGIPRSTAERFMRNLTVYRQPGVRRSFVLVADLEAAWVAEPPIVNRAARR